MPQQPFQAWLFGPFRVVRGSTEITDQAWTRKSARTLLKWFLLNPGQPFTATELCAVLWPGGNGKSSTKNLHVTLHYLRRVLDPDSPSRSPSRFVRTDATGRYSFNENDWWTDVGEVEWLWRSVQASAERDDHDAAIATLLQLVDHYQRGFLPEELYEDAFAHFRDLHERKHDEALHALLKLYGDRSRRYEVLAFAQRILDRDPYSECAVTALVEVHLAQGNLAAAMSELDGFVQTLRDDLGMQPSPRVIALRRRLSASN
ncbi:AfsR/SARP family transcriptional regulator [Kribbella antibiotica]|uniref:AfsR/SARP family transcriptional regulator n=1 Tax=Kribbella antibiotica TaxID=190195 RepID=UPI0014053008|nr:BTAD domain-containing putative transcriptional regulator [Kribbella antibiotica]